MTKKSASDDTLEIESFTEKDKELKKKIDNFKSVLDSIKTSDLKVKTLWQEIYENAISDRENARMMFTDAWSRMQSPGTADHVSIGTTVSKYLERMCKSNEQILRLAELISKVEEENAQINSDDLFSQIGDLSERKSKK